MCVCPVRCVCVCVYVCVCAANDATVPYRNHERILLTYVLANRFVGDLANVKVCVL